MATTDVADSPVRATVTQDGLTLTAFRGDGSALLAFNLDQDLTPHLAGFALQCTPPGGAPYYLPNRLNLQQAVTSAITPEQRTWTPSIEAPFQKFRWMHFPPQLVPGQYRYTATAMYFADGGLRAGPAAQVSLDLLSAQTPFAQFSFGFTRGDLSSQAYAAEFENKPFCPNPRTIDYDTAPYQQQYEWLGFHARKLVFDFLHECLADDAPTATLYERAFEQAFTDMAGFAQSEIAQGWFGLAGAELPSCSVCFSPHMSTAISLNKVADAIQSAKSTVLFAVMELRGGGPVLADLQGLGARSDIFSYGITQSARGLTLFKPGQTNGVFTPFAYLRQHVPPPFQAERDGGPGQVIHHKFVVVDFNDATPIVFTGSSNLAEGGEQDNGDNLLAISDRMVTTTYAIEAIKLVDHYHFRAAMQAATADAPLMLQPERAQWWAPYYDPGNVNCRDCLLFSN